MTRDYSDEAYQKMVNQIKEINEEQLFGFTDAMGDLGLHIGKWTGLIRTEDTEAYRKRMLDMNNTTVEKLNQIFEKVKSIDASNAKTTKKLGERQEVYNSKLASLSNLIQPEVSLPSAEEIKRICSKANGTLKKADTDIDAHYQTTLKGMQKDVVLNTLKGTAGSIVGMGTTLLSMPAKMIKNLATGGPVKMATGAASDTWGLINSVFAVGSGAVTIAAIGIGEVIVKGTGKTKYRELFLEEAEKYSKVEGMADAVIAGSGETKTTKAIKTASNVLDTIDTGANIIQDGKDLITKREGIVPKNPIPKHEALSKKSMIKEYQESGYKHMQNLYNAFEGEANAAGVLNHAYKYASTAFDANEPGGTENAILNNFYEESNLLKDTKDIVGEIDKYKK